MNGTDGVSASMGLLLVATAYVVHWKGLGPDWLAWRAAQVLAFAGLSGVLQPVAPQLRTWSTQALTHVADAVAEITKSSAYSDGIIHQTPKALSGLAFVLWLGAFLTPRASKYLGRIANEQAKASIVWGSGIVMVLFGVVSGGRLQDGINAVATLVAAIAVGVYHWFFGGDA